MSEMAGRAIFISNFADGTTPQDVMALFQRYGSVSRLDMKRRFCFIFMADEEAGRAALANLNHSSYLTDLSHDKKLVVQWARHDRAVTRHDDDRRQAQIVPHETLFIANFHPETTRYSHLESLLQRFGNIVRLDMQERYAFVQFETVQSASTALKELNGTMLEDRRLKIEYSCHIASGRQILRKRNHSHSPKRDCAGHTFNRKRVRHNEDYLNQESRSRSRFRDRESRFASPTVRPESLNSARTPDEKSISKDYSPRNHSRLPRQQLVDGDHSTSSPNLDPHYNEEREIPNSQAPSSAQHRLSTTRSPTTLPRHGDRLQPLGTLSQPSNASPALLAPSAAPCRKTAGRSNRSPFSADNSSSRLDCQDSRTVRSPRQQSSASIRGISTEIGLSSDISGTPKMPRESKRSPLHNDISANTNSRSQSPSVISTSDDRQSRRKSTRSPRQYSGSPHRLDRSPFANSRSPNRLRHIQSRYSRSPHRCSRSPSGYSPVLRRHSRSPGRHRLAPRRCSLSPREYSHSPPRRARSELPNGWPAEQNHSSPAHNSCSPRQRSISPVRSIHPPGRPSRSPRGYGLYRDQHLRSLYQVSPSSDRRSRFHRRISPTASRDSRSPCRSSSLLGTMDRCPQK